MLNGSGEIIKASSVLTSKKGMMQVFGCPRRCRIAMEVGPHSPWVSRLLSSLRHEVIVANARQVKLISTSSRKNDRLMREGSRASRAWTQSCFDLSNTAASRQAHLTEIRARAALIELRTSVVNTARGLVKALGERLAKS
jgi:transposase